jgi:hypothetical protein
MIDGFPVSENGIEGIGSNYGLVYAGFYMVTDNSYDLRCFSSEQNTYQNNLLLLTACQMIPPVNCDFATSVTPMVKPDHFSIFPNPAKEQVLVHFSTLSVKTACSGFIQQKEN